MTDLTNQYTPRTMVSAMRQTPRPSTFLYDLLGLGSNVQRHNTQYIELDKVFGDQLIAGYVNRQGQPHVVGRAGYDNVIHVAPYLKERFVITDEDTEVRDPGTTIYDGIADLDMQVMRGLNQLRDRFTRVDELQAAQALQAGTITVLGEDVDYTVNFGQDAGHLVTLTLADRWTESTATILDDLTDWAQLIDDKGAPGPAWLVGDPVAMRLMLNDTDVRALLDNRRVEVGEINPRLIREQRATFLGTLRYIGLDIDLYSYQGYYETTDGSTVTQTRYMNAGTVVMGSSNAYVRKHFAKISNLKAQPLGFFADQFPLVIEPLDGSSRIIQLESAPMIGLHQPNAFVRAKVTS